MLWVWINKNLILSYLIRSSIKGNAVAMSMQHSNPSIRMCNVMIRIWSTGSQIRLLIFFSLAFKIPTKYEFFSRLICLLSTAGTFSSVFKDNKLFRSHKTVEIKTFLSFLLVNGRICCNLVRMFLRIWKRHKILYFL